MIVAVVEIVDEIAANRPARIIELPVGSALAMASDVCLQRFGACVESTDRVGVVRPIIPEFSLHYRVTKSLKLGRVSRPALTEGVHLHLKHFASEHTLHHVRAIETVHAIGAHDACLPLLDLTRVCRHLTPLVKAALELTDKVSVLEQFLQNDCDQLADILDLPDLCVVVEPVVLHVRVVDLLDYFGEFSTDSSLASLLVDQIDHVLAAVHRVRLVNVRRGRRKTLLEVFIHDHGRVPLHVGLVAPGEGDRTSNLQKGSHTVRGAHALPHRENLFVFAEVSRAAILVQTAGDEAATRPPDIASGNQSHLRFLTDR